MKSWLRVPIGDQHFLMYVFSPLYVRTYNSMGVPLPSLSRKSHTHTHATYMQKLTNGEGRRCWWLVLFTLRRATPRCAALRCAALRCAALRCAVLCYATLRCATLRYVAPRHATLRCAAWRRGAPRNATPRHATLRYAMVSHSMSQVRIQLLLVHVFTQTHILSTHSSQQQYRRACSRWPCMIHLSHSTDTHAHAGHVWSISATVQTRILTLTMCGPSRPQCRHTYSRWPCMIHLGHSTDAHTHAGHV